MKKKEVLIIVLVILLIVVIYFIKKNDIGEFKDDIIFFKNFYSSIGGDKGKEKEGNDFVDVVEVSTRKYTKKEMSLFSNLTNQMDWNKIVCPGTDGEIPIKLYGKEDLEYKIIFKSKNQKPENLVFMVNGKEFKTLEELGDDLAGNLQKGEIKEVIINWKWEYETSKKQDIQDTIDGIQIKEYNFEIITKGEKI